jgi:hypothetical protein
MDIARAISLIETADVARAPSDHIVVEDFMEASAFGRLRAALPPVEAMVRYEPPHRFRYFYTLDDAGLVGLDASIRDQWVSTAALFLDRGLIDALHRKFTPTIRAQTPHRARIVEKVMEAGAVLETPRLMITSDCQDFVLKPHTDGVQKVVTVLYYLAHDGQPEDWGTEFYAPKDASFRSFDSHHFEPENFRTVARAPFRPNTLLAFAKTDSSFHGVNARALEGSRRNMVVLNLELGRRDDAKCIGVDSAFFFGEAEATAP